MKLWFVQCVFHYSCWIHDINQWLKYRSGYRRSAGVPEHKKRFIVFQYNSWCHRRLSIRLPGLIALASPPTQRHTYSVPDWILKSSISSFGKTCRRTSCAAAAESVWWNRLYQLHSGVVSLALLSAMPQGRSCCSGVAMLRVVVLHQFLQSTASLVSMVTIAVVICITIYSARSQPRLCTPFRHQLQLLLIENHRTRYFSFSSSSFGVPAGRRCWRMGNTYNCISFIIERMRCTVFCCYSSSGGHPVWWYHRRVFIFFHDRLCRFTFT